jgi:hypothetical protein
MSQSRYQFLKEKYITPKLITLERLKEIIMADPTSVGKHDDENDFTHIDKVGKYTQWLLKQYEKLYVLCDNGDQLFNQLSEVFFEDLYKINEDLQVYDRIKAKKDTIAQEKKDINNIADAWELYQLVEPHKTIEVAMTKAEVKQKVIAEDVDLLLDGKHWDIITPKTTQAATIVSGPPLTRWCTASEGRNHFESYAGRGTLYILRDKHDIVPSGRGGGQPRPKYQFHFETNSYMDVDDRQQDIVEILRKDEDLKNFFKPLMLKHFLKSKMVQIKFPNDNVSKFISLYGLDDFFNTLPDNITDLDIDCSGASMKMVFKLPKTIRRFKNLEAIFIQGCLEEIPEEIGELENLQNVSFPNNKALKKLPRSLSKLPMLTTLNIKGSENIQISEELRRLDEADKIFIIY